MTSFFVILANIVFSYKGFRDRAFFDKYKFNPNAIKKGENIRYLSSGFLHVNQGHLFVNMFTLFFFAPVVIRLLGDVNFILIYLVSLYVGNMITYRINKNKLNYNAVGASGAVMGVVYSSILLYPNMTLYFIIIPMPAYVFGLLYLWYSIYSMKNVRDNIGHEAHLGGAIAGFFLTIILNPGILVDSFVTVLILMIPIIYFYLKNR
ncbi:MAG: rhomboid family intramembrane serine protease [Bacteroidota bacterium]|nr:rhomboid family intramembrane serine protease [Bacteroidota bacterium]